LTKYRLSRRNALLAPMLRPQSPPYLPGTNAPCVLASERPSRPCDERYPAKPSYTSAEMQLRDLPSVDELARDERLAGEPQALAVEAARAALARAREEISAGHDPGAAEP
jgi:hypothetical protein